MAKEQKQPEPAPDPEEQETLGPPKSYRMQITLALVGLILFQVIVLILLLPSKAQTRGNVGVPIPTPGSDGEFDGPPKVPPIIVPTEPRVSRPIKGEPFKVSFSEGDLNGTFTLVIHVEVRSKEAGRFDKAYEQKEQRILDRVTTVLSGATPSERAEIGNTILKAKLKRDINDILETPWVLEVLVTEKNIQMN